MNITIHGRTYLVVNEWDLARFVLAWRQTASGDLQCWKWRI